MFNSLREAIARDTTTIGKSASYVKTRLGEKSTWAGFITAATGAAALASPWSFLVVAFGVIMVLIPESGGKDA